MGLPETWMCCEWTSPMEAAEEVLALLQSKYPQFVPKEAESFMEPCPLCERR